MRTLSLPHHQITYYQSILEIPAARYLEYQCYAALDAGVGSTEEDALRHEARAERYRASTAARNAQRNELHAFLETNNAHYVREFINIKYSPRQLTFAALIESVNGQPATDITEEGLLALLAELPSDEATQAALDEALSAAKEAFASQLAEHFPARYDTSVEEMVQASHVKRRILALADYLEDNALVHLQKVKEIDELLLEMVPPEVWETGNPDNALVLRRRAFGQLCGVLCEHGATKPEELTWFQFQSRVDYVTAKMKRESVR